MFFEDRELDRSGQVVDDFVVGVLSIFRREACFHGGMGELARYIFVDVDYLFCLFCALLGSRSGRPF